MNLTNNLNRFYVPFWILLDYLDSSPQQPFIEVSIVNKKEQNSITPDGIKKVECCDLLIKKYNDSVNIMAYNVPLDYLIKEDELKEWSEKIAKWFIDYVK